MIQRNIKIFKFLETQNVIAEPAAPVLSERLLEIQKLRPHPRVTESETAFQQGAYLKSVSIKF